MASASIFYQGIGVLFPRGAFVTCVVVVTPFSWRTPNEAPDLSWQEFDIAIDTSGGKNLTFGVLKVDNISYAKNGTATHAVCLF